MSSEQTKVISYSDSIYRALMAEFKTLSTFAEVPAWDERARTEVERIVKVIQDLDAEIVRQTDGLEQAKRAHGEKSFLTRRASRRKA